MVGAVRDRGKQIEDVFPIAQPIPMVVGAYRLLYQLINDFYIVVVDLDHHSPFLAMDVLSKVREVIYQVMKGNPEYKLVEMNKIVFYYAFRRCINGMEGLSVLDTPLRQIRLANDPLFSEYTTDNTLYDINDIRRGMSPRQQEEHRRKEEEQRRQEEALQKARKQKEDMLESAYINACNMERDAHSDESLQDAEDAFRSLGNYKDSMEKYQLCRQRRLEPGYIEACRLQESAHTEEDFSTAEYSFYLLGDYKDSPARKKMCHEASLKAGRESLQQELASLRGFFTGKRRKEIEARLAEIESELKNI